MKKEYINPVTIVITLASPVVLQSASPQGNGEGFGSGSMNTINADASQFYDNGDSNESW